MAEIWMYYLEMMELAGLAFLPITLYDTFLRCKHSIEFPQSEPQASYIFNSNVSSTGELLENMLVHPLTTSAGFSFGRQ